GGRRPAHDGIAHLRAREGTAGSPISNTFRTGLRRGSMERLPDRIGRPPRPTLAGVPTDGDDLRNRNAPANGPGSAVADPRGAELTGTPADRESSPAASAAADGTEEPQPPRPNDGSLRVDEDTPLTAVMRADEFEGFGNLIFPASDRITEGMTV